MEPTSEPVGVLGFQFLDERMIDFDVSLAEPGFAIDWTLEGVQLSPLSNEFFDPAMQ